MSQTEPSPLTRNGFSFAGDQKVLQFCRTFLFGLVSGRTEALSESNRTVPNRCRMMGDGVTML